MYVTYQEDTVKCAEQVSAKNSAESFGQLDRMIERSFAKKVLVVLIPASVT